MRNKIQSLETLRFKLKEIEQADVEYIYQGLSNPEVTKHYAVSFPTLEATQEQMDWFAHLKDNGTGLWWGIYTKESLNILWGRRL